MRPFFHSLSTRFANIELTVLIALLITAASVWAFTELADEVMDRQTQTADEYILRILRNPDGTALGPKQLHEIGRDLTALGGVAFLAGLTAAVAGFLAMRRQYHAMWLVIASTAGGLILSTLLKNFFNRPRPSIVPHLSIVHTPSFPSGHSMLSAVVYLTLGFLLVRFVAERRLKIYIIALAVAMTLLVGLSRVYMGVHYPTDVLAGWTAGLAWALLCWLTARHLQRRGKVEKETQSDATTPADAQLSR